MGRIEQINQKWRESLVFHAFFVVAAVFVLELLLLYYKYNQGLTFYKLRTAVVRFLLLPGGVNLSALLAGYYLNKSESISAEWKNYIVVLMYFLITGSIQITHYDYPPVLYAPVIALFISSFLGDIVLIRLVTILCICITWITHIVAGLELRRGDGVLFVDSFIATMIIICSFLLTTIFHKKEEEHNRLLLYSYETQSRMLYEFRHDYLTGLYNRKTFTDTLEYMIEGDRQVCLAIIDLDDFKKVNDSYGHPVGDKVLCDSAQLLKRRGSENVFISRVGGEEFAVIFIDVPVEQAYQALNEMRACMEQYSFRVSPGGKRIKVTFSGGLAEHRKGQKSEDLYQTADEALYQAKRKGKNTIVIGEKTG